MGKKWKQWQIFFFLGSKITLGSDCSYEIRRRLHLGRTAMANLDSILKSKDIILQTNVSVVKLCFFFFFPVVKYRCKSWTIKMAECQRIDAFKLWCWRRLLRLPWTAKRSNQSVLRKSTLNIHWKDWCRSWSSDNILSTWCEKPTHWKRPWCWERLRAGEGGNRGQDGWMASSAQWTWVWASSGRWWRTGKPDVLQSMRSQSQTWLNNWTAIGHVVFEACFC